MTRLRTIAACHETAARDMLDRVLPPIAPPADCTRFPNILTGIAMEQEGRRMMTGQEAAATPNGLYADSLPPRTFNPDDLLAEVSKVERATLEEKRNKRAYVAEAHARLGAVLGDV